ncbi:MAG: hypothetical protein JW719_14575 [Pirellulales bacterium]|nr:hypothetical protein [Pirellulales bacterium]
MGKQSGVRYFLLIAARACFVLLLLGPVVVEAAQTPRKHHPWATFSPGAWQTVRTTVRVFDKEGKVVDTGITDRMTVLEKVDDQGVTLRVEESVWVADKWLDRPAETVKQGLNGEAEGQKPTIRDLDPETLTIDGRQIPCVVREVQVADAGSKRLQVSKLWLNDDVPPFVLKRTTKISDQEKQAILSETEMTVDALRMPCLVADEVRSAAHARVTTTHPKGKTVTLAYTSTDVPGGTVFECTKKIDKDNRLVEQCVTELTDCGLEPSPDPPRRRLFPRRTRGSRLHSSADETEPGGTP